MLMPEPEPRTLLRSVMYRLPPTMPLTVIGDSPMRTPLRLRIRLSSIEVRVIFSCIVPPDERPSAVRHGRSFWYRRRSSTYVSSPHVLDSVRFGRMLSENCCDTIQRLT